MPCSCHFSRLCKFNRTLKTIFAIWSHASCNFRPPFRSNGSAPRNCHQNSRALRPIFSNPRNCHQTALLGGDVFTCWYHPTDPRSPFHACHDPEGLSDASTEMAILEEKKAEFEGRLGRNADFDLFRRKRPLRSRSVPILALGRPFPTSCFGIS